MKTMKLFALLFALMLCLSVTASAQTAEPVPSELLKRMVAGETFTARLMGCNWSSDGNEITLAWLLCEREVYPAEVVEALQPGDQIVAGGVSYPVYSVSADEWGFFINEGNQQDANVLILTKNDNGDYTATNETDNPFWLGVVTVEVKAAPQLLYLDWSDPEAEQPVALTLEDMINRVNSGEIFLDENNTEITFDAEGNLESVLQRYSPWH